VSLRVDQLCAFSWPLLRTCQSDVTNHATRPAGAAAACQRGGMESNESWEPPFDETPRRLGPRGCVAHREREPGRLQLRFVLSLDEDMHEIVVVENEDSVQVFAIVCGPVTSRSSERVDAPWHVYLERPLGRRRVIDALSGRDVPYRNVLAELAADYGLQYGGADVE
jgi:hypothetical protein